jgi:hypothetical protein
MRRHRRREADRPVDGRLPDGDTVPVPGYRRWVDLLPTPPALVVNPHPPAELVRPYVRQQEGPRWPS